MSDDHHTVFLLVRLRNSLRIIDRIDPSANGRADHEDAGEEYAVRNAEIWRALNYATRLGYPCGVAPTQNDTEWPVAYIDLPTGQISWHMPPYDTPWDQHDGDEKRRRIHAYLNPTSTQRAQEAT